jgi:purine-nucleoside phosphorylase
MAEFLSRAQVEEAATVIRGRSQLRPAIGLVLGSGLGGLADTLQEPETIPYEELPQWPVSTVSGHHGRLILGRLEGQAVLVQQGRVHFYEGYSAGQITLPVRVMHALGVKTVILTNAAGGLNKSYTPGDLMLIRDHINLPGLAGNNPLRGPNDDAAGPRFPDMTEPYDPALRRLAHEVAAEQGFSIREGIYVHVAGPSYETPAELRFLQTIGGDAVGMSTVPEAIVARHAGMRLLAISTITNLALPDPPAGTILTHDEVLAAGQIAVPRLTSLLHGLLRRL